MLANRNIIIPYFRNKLPSKKKKLKINLITKNQSKYDFFKKNLFLKKKYELKKMSCLRKKKYLTKYIGFLMANHLDLSFSIF